MGYSTNYSLSVKNLKESVTEPVTLESLIKEVEKGNLTKTQILKRLNDLKNGVVLLREEDIIERFRAQNEEANYCLSDDGSCESAGKWYESVEDIKAFSLCYPGWLFTLNAEGEEAGDLWKAYIIDGTVQKVKAQIMFEPFNCEQYLKN